MAVLRDYGDDLAYAPEFVAYVDPLLKTTGFERNVFFFRLWASPDSLYLELADRLRARARRSGYNRDLEFPGNDGLPPLQILRSFANSMDWSDALEADFLCEQLSSGPANLFLPSPNPDQVFNNL